MRVGWGARGRLGFVVRRLDGTDEIERGGSVGLGGGWVAPVEWVYLSSPGVPTGA